MLFLDDDTVPDMQSYVGWRVGTGALVAPELTVVVAFGCVLILWVLAAFLMGCPTTNSGAWGLKTYFLGCTGTAASFAGIGCACCLLHKCLTVFPLHLPAYQAVC